ncbi:hypothetical protein ABZ714_19595 [Streptomyces sp. NPDC006798]|uniref:hypothetical protein n=1 Tax=Streptomyces sp. NPDC006798 TaxID=3155462 RepID=UPI0034047440
MPHASDLTPCPRCGRPVLWTVTAAGRRLPVNPGPDPAGNAAVYTDATGRVRSRALTTLRPVPEHAEWRAMPHPATCTNPHPNKRNNGRHSGRTGRLRPAPQPWQRRPR